MEYFCGAFDIAGRGVDFSLLHCMNGNKSSGCAYVNGELGIVCGIKDISPDRIQPITRQMGGNVYTLALLCNGHGDIDLAQEVLECYIDGGVDALTRIDQPCALVLYDSRRAELYLLRSAHSRFPIFLVERNTVVYFFTRLLAIYKLCESVGIKRWALLQYLRTQRSEDAYLMFCDIEVLCEGDGALYTRFGRSNMILESGIENTRCGEKKGGAYTDIREALTSALFENGYPVSFDVPEGRKLLKRLEAELDRHLYDLRTISKRKSFCAFADEILLSLKKEKSTPRRIIAKGMLYQTLVWAEHFNIYFV